MAAATTTWHPSEEALPELAKCLSDSLGGGDRNAQRKAELMLKNAKASPDIYSYLAFLLSNPKAPPGVTLSPDNYHSARSAAALMLKNGIKTSYKSIAPESKAYISSVILLGLQDSNAQIRGFTGTVITEIVHQVGIMGWPEVLGKLVNMVQSNDSSSTPERQQGAMSALLKICEDHRKALDLVYDSQRPSETLIPKLLEFTAIQNTKVRADALACINVFILEKSNAVMPNLENFMGRLVALANDPSDDVRKQICRAIVQTAEMAPAMIQPHMAGLVDYMITQQQSQSDPELALDAAEFWLCLGEDQNLRGTLGPYLPKIVPTLLASMVYAEDDVARLEAEAEDNADIDDSEQDIKPHFATSKAARFAGANGAGNNSGSNTQSGADLSDGEVEEFADDSDDEDPEEQWNLRKCSAAALDVLASIFHDAVFTTIMPYLKETLNSSDWPKREAAVLAIGAIAEGCMDVIEPHLPGIIPFLINLLNDENPVVRQITCWSLGRYSGWAAHLDQPGKDQFFLPMMDGILQRMLDKNKRVQEAAASAFANLEEKADNQLANPQYFEVIARQFAKCFERYKDRNMFILYDCVQTLAEHVGSELQNTELVHGLMPALMKRWENVADESKEMFPLLECLSYVSTALGNSFEPYAAPLYARCVNLIAQNLARESAALENPELDRPDKDFLVTSLDLVSAIFQALGTLKSVELVKNSPHNLFELLSICLADESCEARQSAYALLGDCAIYVFSELQPWLQKVLPLVLRQLDISPEVHDEEDTSYAVSNNACWSCGEIAMKHRELMQPYSDQIMERFGLILTNEQVPSTLHENAAIALGRLGMGCPEKLAQHLQAFAPLFLRVMATMDFTDEKANALSGFTAAATLNPAALGQDQTLLAFFLELARVDPRNEALREERAFDIFKQALVIYKSALPNFEAYVNHLPAADAQALRSKYLDAL